MDSALGWIGQLVEWIGQFFPRWRVLDPTTGAVKVTAWHFRRPRQRIEIRYQRDGIVVWWPAVTELYTHPVAEQINDLPTQTIELADGTVMAARAVISYEITDLQLLLTSVSDPDDSIKDLAGGAVHAALTGYDTKEALRDANRSGELDRRMKSEAHNQLKHVGVKTKKVQLLELAPCGVYRVLTSEPSDAGKWLRQL